MIFPILDACKQTVEGITFRQILGYPTDFQVYKLSSPMISVQSRTCNISHSTLTCVETIVLCGSSWSSCSVTISAVTQRSGLYSPT
ncbi:hypothetical protein Hypma_001768 [Hypsizygus marmoreus]|uniref:Uncharacterized protein n=1 Tax=Hypsizygus marmoreus TaxID=39966 RepID=A0A369J5B9_HYPMA|nr:hypothetical protein Hypma_001768 [Hypsizygus marmoreus]